MRNKNELLESMTQNNIKEMNLVKKKKKIHFKNKWRIL